MPIWLRKFTFLRLKEFYDKRNEEESGQSTTSAKKISRPGIDPSYSTKASK